MTGRLAELEGRIGSVEKLGAVVGAMRGIATARVQEARDHAAAIRAYAGTIGEAIAEALAMFPVPEADTAPGQDKRGAVILIAAEQGFVGTYNEQVFATADPLLSGGNDLLLVGHRGAILAAEAHRHVRWSGEMIVHPAQAVALVTRMTDALFAMLAEASVAQVRVVHAAPVSAGGFEVVTKRLVPFDYARFAHGGRSGEPRITLPPDRLLASLTEEYIVAELIEAVVLAFAAENIARMRAMVAAHENVAEKLDSLVATSRRLRQDEITEEIAELAAGRART
ncbi:F0F1 ATP synthase subunit gamma [Sagittula sp. MA-2]|jgi:F-type H+-transporting ATPase subunit gamma|uniref:F0F1 ATP synthase subunit gamma n=1 Tax=Sagittula sp. MA-2 TaxID=3048007 RepID=UPI0024C38DE9|nr:FoF1 ATP synthase subunit gamma [Sagittula sp. MA-2]WHZ36601.1 FoF1 ATP synthase subunit gamma [Sagittula sp. MA-2]